MLRQVMELWIGPEVERRKGAGAIGDNFVLTTAQVILDVGRPPQVRLNEEVLFTARVRVKRAMRKGEPVSHADVGEIADMELTDRDPDSGHITIINHDGFWWIGFDFRYNARRVSMTLKRAEQFFSAVQAAMTAGHPDVFVENLFSAVELLARSFLMMMPDSAILAAKTHKFVSSRFNKLAKVGTVE